MHKYVLIDDEMNEIVRYVDRKITPPHGCRIERTGYKAPTKWERVKRICDELGGLEALI